MALTTSSTDNQGLTPPDNPTKGTTTSQAIAKDLKHLFGMLLEKLLGLTNQEPPNTPVCRDQSPPALDQVREVLDCVSAELSVATKPDKSSSTSDERENLPGPDEFDVKKPICTTPEDFQSFENWDKEACKYKIAEPTKSSGCLDDCAEYAFVVRERVDRNSEEVTPYIDIKSEGLRDILRGVLYDIKATSLMEDKPSSSYSEKSSTDADDADLGTFSRPTTVLKALQIETIKHVTEHDAEIVRSLSSQLSN
ncbi:hypothetical protein NUU61_004806 [Penicillium alfredii]|uniref:Uncharacterized protein n=1 Tax=Penicillium alfredii TaxID=1506179 RepID=A0A9W9F884_9EURO|nr:uncharacterized protein NUU61_004806 [Penicillium alfredii]KAJ5095450.1 hypothetical protein NUU61_004806 [Penicillium alfredii]